MAANEAGHRCTKCACAGIAAQEDAAPTSTFQYSCATHETGALVLSNFQYACRKAYAPLVEAGYVEVVYGATKEGSFLCNHELVKSIHLTGSTATYDAVVWGGKKKVLFEPL